MLHIQVALDVPIAKLTTSVLSLIIVVFHFTQYVNIRKIWSIIAFCC